MSNLNASALDLLVAPGVASGTLEPLGWRIGSEVAAPVAEDVDQNARFPHEAVAVMREVGLLAALAPVEFRGQGDELRLDKHSLAISYGAHADVISSLADVA